MTIEKNLAKFALKALLASVTLTTSVTTAYALPPAPANVPVENLPKSLYIPKAEIEAWKKADARSAMQEHAWKLFAAVMKPIYNDNGSTIRLYDTWHSLDEVVPPINTEVIDFKVLVPKRSLSKLRHVDAQDNNSAHSGSSVVSSAIRDNQIFSEALVSDVKYNTAIGKWVENNLMNISVVNGKNVVTSYNLSGKKVPGAPAGLVFADTTAVMLKPAYTIVKGNGPTVIGRWQENISTVNPKSIATQSAPVNADTRISGERTWVQEAVVFPPLSGTGTNYYGRDGKPLLNTNTAGLPAYNLSDFHYFKISQATMDALKTGILAELMGPNFENIEVGDYAILTSMHIATRETDDWTWQTFWWQPLGGPNHDANGVPGDVKALFASADYKPLSFFRAGVGYDYFTPTGAAVICANPYLEGNFGMKPDLDAVFGVDVAPQSINVFLRDANDQPLNVNGTQYTHAGKGLQTNCVSCHKAAAYPAGQFGNLPAGTKGVYTDNGKLSGTEDLFIGRLRTHFLWGVANKVTDREEEAAAP
jgi:hypothetical protein